MKVYWVESNSSCMRCIHLTTHYKAHYQFIIILNTVRRDVQDGKLNEKRERDLVSIRKKKKYCIYCGIQIIYTLFQFK